MVDNVEEIKRRVDAVEYIGRATRLQKAGRNFRGLCPFHTEKTPSFYVFPDRGTWRCFGSCGEGGDLFSFVQKRENVEFRDALQLLAGEAGIELSRQSAARRGRTDLLASILSASVDFYQRRLAEAEGAEARAYISERRGLTTEAVGAFRLGWAPDEWRALRDHLASRGYEEGDCVAAGVLVAPESGGNPYDRFRGRVIIPIADERGQYVALGGRGLHGEEPKYLNSPQTELFDKGRTLFGLDLCAKGIRDTGVAVVVEGYMDVIGPWQAGFANVVATMGTSLTEQHAALLRRYAKRIVLAMDPDAAGMAAAERAGALFFGLDSPATAARSARSAESLLAGKELELRVAPLPAGKDPDEVAREDPEGWRSAIAQAAPYAEFLLMRLIGDEAPDSPVEARRIVDRLRPVLLAVSDPVERAMYVQRVARKLGIAEPAVYERLRASARRAAPLQATNEEVRAADGEETLLALLLRYPFLRAEFRDVPERLFTDAVDRELFRRWLQAMPPPDEEDAIEVRRRAVEARRLPPLSEEHAVRAAREKVNEITRERYIQHQAAVSEQLAEAERTLGADTVARIANDVWRGLLPPEERRELAETVIEDLHLGLSIHRREETGTR